MVELVRNRKIRPGCVPCVLTGGRVTHGIFSQCRDEVISIGANVSVGVGVATSFLHMTRRTESTCIGIMDKEMIRDYLAKSGMADAQSEALAKIFAQMATKADIRNMFVD